VARGDANKKPTMMKHTIQPKLGLLGSQISVEITSWV